MSESYTKDKAEVRFLLWRVKEGHLFFKTSLTTLLTFRLIGFNL